MSLGGLPLPQPPHFLCFPMFLLLTVVSPSHSSQKLFTCPLLPPFLLIVSFLFPYLFFFFICVARVEPRASHMLGKNSVLPFALWLFPVPLHRPTSFSPLISFISIFSFSFSSFLYVLPFPFLSALPSTPSFLCSSFLLSPPGLPLCSCPRRPLADPPLLPWLPGWFQRAFRSPGEP